MNARLAFAVDEARAALSDADQNRLAEIVAAYTHDRQAPPSFTDEGMAEIRRRMDEPFDPAPEHEIRAFFDRHCG